MVLTLCLSQLLAPLATTEPIIGISTTFLLVAVTRMNPYSHDAPAGLPSNGNIMWLGQLPERWCKLQMQTLLNPLSHPTWQVLRLLEVWMSAQAPQLLNYSFRHDQKCNNGWHSTPVGVFGCTWLSVDTNSRLDSSSTFAMHIVRGVV